MSDAKKSSGKLTRRLACPTCGGRLRKFEIGNYACDGDCKETYKQMELWKDERNDRNERTQ